MGSLGTVSKKIFTIKVSETHMYILTLFFVILFYVSNMHPYFLYETLYNTVNYICEKRNVGKGMIFCVSFYNFMHVKDKDKLHRMT